MIHSKVKCLYILTLEWISDFFYVEYATLFLYLFVYV